MRALACWFDPIASPLEVKAGEAIEGDIEIRYKGQPVKNLFLVQANLKNTGNMAIRQSDVVEPLAFTFGPNAELVRPPRFLEKTPDNLAINWILPDEPPPTPRKVVQVYLVFDLLNPGDEFKVEFLCTGESGVPEASARIEGIQEIETHDPEEVILRERVQGGKMLILMGSVILALVYIISWFAIIRPFSNDPDNVLVGPCCSMMLIMLFVPFLLFFEAARYMYELARYRRRKRKS